MACIPKYHTAVAMFPVDPADVALINTGSSDATYGIYAGQIVGINSAGYVKHATKSDSAGAAKFVPVGIAADSMAVSAGHTAYQDSLVVSATGIRKGTQNRVSDMFNETLGSGLLSVYIVGGEFYTDMYMSSESSNFVPGALVYNQGAAAYTTANAGMLSTTSATNYVVGVCTSIVQGYPSGVPGVGGAVASVDYSMPLSTFNTNGGFVSFILNIQI